MLHCIGGGSLQTCVEQHIFLSVIAVTQGCCQPVLQSSSEQWEMHVTEISVAVHWWWVTAHLYEQQIFIGVIAVTQGCCRPVLKSSTQQWSVHSAKISVALHWWWVTADLYGQQIFIGVIAVTQGCCQPVLHSRTEQYGQSTCRASKQLIQTLSSVLHDAPCACFNLLDMPLCCNKCRRLIVVALALLQLLCKVVAGACMSYMS